MALKLLFLLQNRENDPAAGGSAPSVTRLTSNGLFSTGPKLDNSCAKNIYFWFKPHLSYQNPGYASGRIHYYRHIFQAIIPAACKTSY